MPSETSVQSTGWVVTAFKDNVQNSSLFFSGKLPYGMNYACWQLEACPTTKNLHFQAYVEYEKKVRPRKVCADIGCPIEKLILWKGLQPRKGTAIEARDYALKLGKWEAEAECRVQGPWQVGKFVPLESGYRTDIEEACETIMESGKEALFEQRQWSALKSLGRLADQVEAWRLESLYGKSDRPVQVWAICGPPGGGKTTGAYTAAGGYSDCYKLEPPRHAGDLPWFSGYKGQKFLLIDEWRPDKYPWDWLYGLLEGRPQRLWVHNGWTWAAWNTVIITSNFSPEFWFTGSWTPNALFRRITYYYSWKKWDDWKVCEVGEVSWYEGEQRSPPRGNNIALGGVKNPGIPKLFA